jgi:streptomycin 6-kinase
MELPKRFIDTIINIWRSEGSAWLDQLPQLVSHFSCKWNLTNIKICDTMQYNYVAFAYSCELQSDVVLKICLPSDEFIYEQQALLFFKGQGCIKLYDYDLSKGGMLLEAIKPGTTLKTLFPHNDMNATLYAADLIKKLHHGRTLDPAHTYPTINTWLALLDNADMNSIPSVHLHNAQALTHHLLTSQKDLYLLHGDLHHENILLSSQNSWTAIDPKGVIGELAYEVGALIRNPIVELLEQQNPHEIIARRLSHFSKVLAIERQRLVDWSYTQAILAACWAMQDKSNSWQKWILCAELIKPTTLNF